MLDREGRRDTDADYQAGNSGFTLGWVDDDMDLQGLEGWLTLCNGESSLRMGIQVLIAFTWQGLWLNAPAYGT